MHKINKIQIILSDELLQKSISKYIWQNPVFPATLALLQDTDIVCCVWKHRIIQAMCITTRNLLINSTHTPKVQARI